MLIVLKSGSLSLLEPSGHVQVCNGIDLPLPLPYVGRCINLKRSEGVHLIHVTQGGGRRWAVVNKLKLLLPSQQGCSTELLTYAAFNFKRG